MLQVRVQADRITFDAGFQVVFERTLRIPDDGKTYPLPPGLGAFPIKRVQDYAARVPAHWVEQGGVFIPMYQREAMWLRFATPGRLPHAIKVAVGKVNAVSGESWDQALRKEKKDYLVSPPQPWLDGINAGKDMIRQFVAMPLGMGYTVEAQVTGEETVGGLQMIVYAPKPGFVLPRPVARRRGVMFAKSAAMGGAEMGLGAGGKMHQKIYPDPHGIDTWDPENYGRVFVHIVNSLAYREITGEEPPPTPVTAQTYAQYKLPWYDLYDEHMADTGAPQNLQDVKSIKEMDAAKGFAPQQDDTPVDVPDGQVIKYPLSDDGSRVNDGDW